MKRQRLVTMGLAVVFALAFVTVGMAATPAETAKAAADAAVNALKAGQAQADGIKAALESAKAPVAPKAQALNADLQELLKKLVAAEKGATEAADKAAKGATEAEAKAAAASAQKFAKQADGLLAKIKALADKIKKILTPGAVVVTATTITTTTTTTTTTFLGALPVTTAPTAVPTPTPVGAK